MNKFTSKKNSTPFRREIKNSPKVMTEKVTTDTAADDSTIEQRLLFLVPLVQVAWSHGIVSTREKHLIFEAARADGIDERHAHNDTLDKWLNDQPNRQFYSDSLERLSGILQQMTVRNRESERSKLLSRCTRVAAVTNDERFDCDGSISAEERGLLAQIVAGLDYHPPKAVAGAFA